MDISWLGATCFRLQSSGLQLITDPFDLPPSTPPLAGDVVTVSRRVPRERLVVGQVHRIVDGPGEYEIRGVPITGIATMLKDEASADRRNIIYTAVQDGVTVCHLGRLDQLPSAAQLQEIGSPDVVLIPIGEGVGLTSALAVQLVSQLETHYVLPVPLDGPGGPADPGVVDRFCRELGADPANFSAQLSVTRSGLPAQVKVVRLSTAPTGGAPHA
jgi:L-ascorbate metabolism protein UlaG (beta-lactamase superfamily)